MVTNRALGRLLAAACGVWGVLGAMAEPLGAADRPGKDAMQIASAAFAEGTAIPSKYTCEGANVSPPLKWSGAPAQTKALVLIADDPDAPAGTWVHWVLYNLPPTVAELPEGQPKDQQIPLGGWQGLNDFKRLGYGGPCPPPGKPHRYFFKLYALDRPLQLKPGATKREVEQTMEEHILAHAQIMGTFQRK